MPNPLPYNPSPIADAIVRLADRIGWRLWRLFTEPGSQHRRWR